MHYNILFTCTPLIPSITLTPAFTFTSLSAAGGLGGVATSHSILTSTGGLVGTSFLTGVGGGSDFTVT